MHFLMLNLYNFVDIKKTVKKTSLTVFSPKHKSVYKYIFHCLKMQTGFDEEYK